MLAIYLLLQSLAFAEAPAERMARLETQVIFLTATINRIESKVDRLPQVEEKNNKHFLTEHGLEGLLGLLIVLDKGGYYIRRRSYRMAKEKAGAEVEDDEAR